MDFIEELKWRNLFKDCTDEEALRERLKTPLTLYCGYDPTADSLHIGHLQQLILLKRYQNEGHHPIALIGGGTGMIGDPRPTTERSLLSDEAIKHNADSLTTQIKHILASESNPIRFLNNAEWLTKLNLIDFLRDFGKYFSVNTMIAKDTVAKRLDSGISFTEFSYTILQAIDWLKLYQNYDCLVQIGGSDQWGNLVSGTELIRKVEGSEVKVYGITSPLITKSDGTKFGKSEGKNIWLDPARTSPYDFYQYLVNVSDSDIEDYLKRLSLAPVETLKTIIAESNEQPHLRIGQKFLAKELTALVFSDKALEDALFITEILFSGEVNKLSISQLNAAFNKGDALNLGESMDLVSVLVEVKAASSKREARELISKQSISINGEKIGDTEFIVSKEHALFEQYTIIRKGKKHYFLLSHE